MNPKASPPLFKEDLEHILEHTRELWEEMRGKSLFLTGGTGFFGIWLVESFLYINTRLSLNASIHVLTRDTENFRKKAPHLISDRGLSMLPGDVRAFRFPEARIFEYMVHAGTTSSAPVPPKEMFSTIVDGTRNVLHFANTCGTRKLLFVSSGAVYGPQPEAMTHIDEDFLGGPSTTSVASAYGEGKRAAELLCTMNASPLLECKIARCFAFVGPHLPMDAHFAIGNFIRDAISGCDIQVKGDGTAQRSYLYAADLALWLWTILFTGRADRPYNVGSETACTMQELAEEVRTATVCERKIHFSNAPQEAGKSNKYIPATYRASQELNLRNHHSLRDAIRKTATWLRYQASFQDGSSQDSPNSK